jgi:hypothetical protein
MSEIKNGKVKKVTPYSKPYAKSAKSGVEPDTQAYTVQFEDGTSGIMEGLINSAPVIIGGTYHYAESATSRGNTRLDIVTTPYVTKSIAAAVPGVTTADKVSPQLQKPTRTFAEAAAATKKGDPEVSVAPASAVPDNQPRKGVVKSAITNVKDDFKGSDGMVLHKYAVTMEDGTTGNIWVEGNASAPKPGDTINYTLDPLTSKGTPYKDGTKRIDLVPEGSAVGKELLITRMACVNSAIALLAIPDNIKNANYEPTLENTIVLAKYLEAHVMRSID